MELHKEIATNSGCDGKNTNNTRLENVENQGVAQDDNFFQANIMSNELLTDKILGSLTDSELLNCSLVSKTWSSTCRSILRRHRKCYLRIATTNTATSFNNLLILLESSVNPPFNGISLNTPTYLVENLKQAARILGSDFPPQDALTPIAELFEKIYEKIDMINVFMDLTEPCTFLVESIVGTLFRYASRIEYLHIRWFMDVKWIFKRLVPNGLPNLRVLRISPMMEGMKPKLIQPLLQASPKLIKFIGVIFLFHIPMFATAKKLSLAKHVEINIKKRSTAEELEYIKTYGVAFEKAKITGLRYCAQNLNIKEQVNMLASGLSPTQETLKELEINYLEMKILQIAKPDFPPFPNCETLTLLYDLKCPGEILNLKWVNFTLMFPNLKSVVVVVITKDGRVPMIWEKQCWAHSRAMSQELALLNARAAGKTKRDCECLPGCTRTQRIHASHSASHSVQSI